MTGVQTCALPISAAASLAGQPLDQTDRLLAELTRVNLLTEIVPGRFGRHDLMRAYAAERVQVIESAPDRDAALARMFDYYLHTARAATLLLDPHQSPVPMTPPVAGVALDPPTDYNDALAWCDAERVALVAAVHRGDEQRHDAVTWRLAVALNTYLHLRGGWDDLVATQEAGLLRGHQVVPSTPQVQVRVERHGQSPSDRVVALLFAAVYHCH